MKMSSICRNLKQQTTENLVKGFTLVELLVVVIIVGILTAISLPAYLNLTSTAKQTEARQNINALMTAQHLWIDEHAVDVYPTSLDQLATSIAKGSGLSDSTSSSVYVYSISSSTIDRQLSAGASPKTELKTYTGGIRSFVNNAGKSTWYSVVCESRSVSEALANPTTSGSGTNSVLDCPTNYNAVKVSGK